jgi:hypothetical protein
MSHWHVSAVANALSRQDSAGRGRENITLNAPGSQLGKRLLRMARVASCVSRADAYCLFSRRVSSMMAG